MPITEGTNVAPVDNAGTKLPPLYDLTNLFMFRRAAAAVMSLLRAEHAMLVAMPGEWSINAVSSGTASVSRAAGGAGVRHVLRSLTFTLAAGATAQPAIFVYVRDGAAGVGTILWQGLIACPINDTRNLPVTGINLLGSANTAMTIEFSAAAAATVTQGVSGTGFDVA